VGSRIGRFSIRSKIGQGGMGVVYLGYDAQLNRLTAIKLLRSDREHPDGHARMLREARALASMSHPNVVQVYEVGEDGSNIYIAMEFVDGPTLREWFESGRRDPFEICDRFIAAGHGLAAVHDRGFIHRDFKPDNVMVGADGRVRVMDFGLVTVREGSVELDERLVEASDARDLDWPLPAAVVTTTGACLGTPAYMAPEQYQGTNLDARTDQFAFCVSLWEALHGRHPFVGQTRAPPTERPIRSPPSGDRIPRQLSAIIERGLATDPAARWPSMLALLTELDGGLREHMNDGRPARRRAESLDPNRIVLAAIFGLITAAVGGYIASYPGVALAAVSTLAMLVRAEKLSSRGAA
jgi:serine/threonine protein kinase